MRSVIAVVLCASLLAPGCAVRSSSLGPRLDPAGVAPQGGEIPRAYAEQLPVGKEVEVRLKSGEHFKGTFMGVEGDAVRVQPSTRIPVPPRVVPLDDLAQLRLSSTNSVGAIGKAIIIGATTGAAVFLGLLLVAIAASD
jgi:hypothetical protein